MMFKEIFDKVRETAPLIQCITNYVTVNDVANVLLACGGSPIMADELCEMNEMATICNGLAINIGTTLNKRVVSAMLKAGKKANALNHPVLLDPVGAGASKLRTSTCYQLMKKLNLTAIKGNASEIRALAKGSGSTKGVDAAACDLVSESNLSESVAFVKACAKKWNTLVAMTGAIDLVSDGNRCFVIRNGRAEMEKITGTGCQLAGVMCAFLAANPNTPLEAAAAATVLLGYAGEVAWDYLKPEEGNATYRNRVIDAIFHMRGEALAQGAKYEIL